MRRAARTFFSYLFILLAAWFVLGCDSTVAPSASVDATRDTAMTMVQNAVPSTVVIPLTASKWTEGLSPTYVKFKNDTAGRLYVDFPSSSPQKTWNYAYAPSPVKIVSGRLTATVTLSTLSGTPAFFGYPDAGNTCNVLPNTRPFIFAYSTKDWSRIDGRWWAKNAGWTLVSPGTYTWSVPLTVDQWSDVYGGSDPVQFANALKNVSAVGFTFGHGCFYGHGVYTAGGTSRWTLSSLIIQ